MNDFKLIVNEIKKTSEKFMQIGQANFNNLPKLLFDKIDKVKMICFHTYVPGFNDGEACEFTVDGPYFLPHEENNEEDFESENYDYQELADNTNSAFYVGNYLGGDKRLTEGERIILKDFETAFNSIPHNIIQASFGTHVAVFISRDSTRICDYDCGY